MGFQGLAGFGGGATGLAQAGGAAAFDGSGDYEEEFEEEEHEWYEDE